MREILILAIHLLVTLARLLRPGGVRAVAAESLLLKHQLLISNRSRQRAPNLTFVDRFVLGLATLFVRPHRSMSAPITTHRVFFWNAADLARKLEAFRDYYNGHRVHRALAGLTPVQFAGALSPAPAALDHYGWQQHCRGLFELPIAT